MSRLINPHNYSFEANYVSWGFITFPVHLRMVTETFRDRGGRHESLGSSRRVSLFYIQYPFFSASAMCEVLTTHVAEDAAASYVQLLSPWGSDPRQHSCRQGFRAPERYRQLAFHHSSLKAAFYESSLSWQRNSHPSVMTKR